MDDVCKKATKLNGCCCAAAVEALWQLQLPVNIRAHVSNMTFDHTTFKEVFEAADKVFLSSKQVSVAALQVAAVDLNETQAAFNPENQPQIAAMAKNKPPKKNKKNKNAGGGGGGQPQTKPRGQKHDSVPDNLAEKLCAFHHKHGVEAWYCVAPLTCPWKSKSAPRSS